MMRRQSTLFIALLASAGLLMSVTQPARAADGEQLSAAMKAADDRNNELRERLKREREERRAEAERQAQENKASAPSVEQAQFEAPKPVNRRDTARIEAERKALAAERKALEAERKAKEAERRAKEAMAKAEEAERQRLAMEAEQRAKEEALKAQAMAELQMKQQQQMQAAAAAKAKAKIDEACIDPVGTAEEIARLCGGPAPSKSPATAVATKKDGPATAGAPAAGGNLSTVRK